MTTDPHSLPGPRTVLDAERVAFVLVALYAVVGLFTFRSYGITWDETVQSEYGRLVLHYYLSGGSDLAFRHLFDLRFYGPAFETLCAAVGAVVHVDRFLLRHLLVLVTGVLTAAGVIRLVRKLPATGGPVAPLAVAALVLLPRFYGHAFADSKDVPFACAFTWSMVAILGLVDDASAPDLRAVLRAALFIGVTLAIRIAGVALLGLGVVALAADAWTRDRAPHEARRVALRMAALTAGAFLVMVALWPWAQQSPVIHSLKALEVSARFPHALPVRFKGAFVPPASLPRTYLPWMLGITTPLLVLGLATVGAGVAIRRLVAGPRRPRVRLALVLGWLLGPIAAALVLHPNLYDGVRQFLFVLPALAILAGIGGAWLVARPPRRALRLAASGALGALALVVCLQMARLHPYEATYYNALVGGTGGAAGRYELDYWASSYRAAALWVIGHADRLARHRPLRILLGGNQFAAPCFAHYLPPGFAEVVLVKRTGQGGAIPPGYDAFVSTTRWGLSQDFPASPVVHTVGRAGATFTVIRAREAPAP